MNRLVDQPIRAQLLCCLDQWEERKVKVTCAHLGLEEVKHHQQVHTTGCCPVTYSTVQLAGI